MALKEDAIYVELSTRIQELKGAVGPDVDDLKHDVAIIQGEIPSNASSENKFAVASDVSRIDLDISQLSSSVLGIQSVIPDNASSENKLATSNDIPDITSIEAMIPSNASSENKFAVASDVSRIDLDISQLSSSMLGITSVIPSNASSSNKLVTAEDSLLRSITIQGATYGEVLAAAHDYIIANNIYIEHIKCVRIKQSAGSIDRTYNFLFYLSEIDYLGSYTECRWVSPPRIDSSPAVSVIEADTTKSGNNAATCTVSEAEIKATTLNVTDITTRSAIEGNLYLI